MKYLTTCQLKKADGTICKQEFTANELPGQSEESAQGRTFVDGLRRHLDKKHREIYDEIQKRGLYLMGCLILRCFESQDPQTAELQKTLADIAINGREVQKTA